MTRLFNDGAEFGDLLFWDITTGLSLSSTTKRTGAYSYQMSSNGARKVIPALSQIYFRFAFYASTPLESRLVRFLTSGDGEIGAAWTTAMSTIDYHFGSDAAPTSVGSQRVINNSYNLLEIYLNISNTGNFQTKLNGVDDINYSGDTMPGAYTTVTQLTFYNSGSCNYLDDLALNSTDNSDGKNDNSWCGDGHYERLTPNDNGDTNTWTGSDGDSVNNYALVDEVPDSATDYVKSSTALQQDLYKVSDFTATGKIVTRVFAEVRAKDNDATSGQIKLGFKTGGTVYLSSAARTLSGNYAKVVGDDAKVNPADSGAWEDADLDDIQFAVECE